MNSTQPMSVSETIALTSSAGQLWTAGFGASYRQIVVSVSVLSFKYLDLSFSLSSFSTALMA